MTTLTSRLFEAAKPVWDAQAAHPFVRGIADGSLDEDIFKRWVKQDYLYLKEFSRVFAWAAAKAHTLSSMSWYARMLDLTLNTEMALHRKYAARFGISEEELENEKMWLVNQGYTDFLVRTSAAGDLSELLAALLPCAWGYVYIANSMVTDKPPEDRRYAEWIEQYNSAEFAEAAEWLRNELDSLGGNESRLSELFLLSSKYELLFWDMCWHGAEHVLMLSEGGIMLSERGIESRRG